MHQGLGLLRGNRCIAVSTVDTLDAEVGEIFVRSLVLLLVKGSFGLIVFRHEGKGAQTARAVFPMHNIER